MSARLESKDAAAVNAQAAPSFIQAMKDAKDSLAFAWLADGLSALSARMDAKDAANVAAGRPHPRPGHQRRQGRKRRGGPARSLSGLSADLDPEVRRASRAHPRPGLEGRQGLSALHFLWQSLAAVSARLGAADAAQVAAILIQALKDAKNPIALPLLADSLSAVSAAWKPRTRPRPRSASFRP